MSDPQPDDPREAHYKRNSAYAKKQASYQTELPADQEKQFLAWLAANKVPFNPADPKSDYDMRGFWAALQKKDPKATSAVDPNDNRLHYPDYWKTPYHETFSNESQWAAKGAPAWNDKDQLVMPDGTVVFDDRAPKADAIHPAVKDALLRDDPQ
jgi:hypothetical protein